MASSVAARIPASSIVFGRPERGSSRAFIAGWNDRKPPLPPPPNKHELALMIWFAVFPTLTVLNLAVGPVLPSQHPVLLTLILSTIAVPIVICVLMPQLHRLRARLLSRPTAG